MLQKSVYNIVVLLALWLFNNGQELPAQAREGEINLLASKGTTFWIENSDPFDVVEAKINGEQLEIKVRYFGGYVKHDFEIVWPVIITDIDHPRFRVVLNHNSNYDLNETLITQVLHFDIRDSRLGLSSQALRNTRITIVNGSNKNQKVSTR